MRSSEAADRRDSYELHGPSIRQIYTTRIISEDSKREVEVVSVPGRFMPMDFVSPNRPINGEVLATLLGLEFEAYFKTFAQLPFATYSVLNRRTAKAASSEFRRLVRDPNQVSDEPLFAFASRLVSDHFIPFEFSPLSSASLAEIARSPMPLAIAITCGVVGFGAQPLLFVAVPAGMILLGAARGVSRALEEGLYERVLRLINPSEQARISRQVQDVTAQEGAEPGSNGSDECLTVLRPKEPN